MRWIRIIAVLALGGCSGSDVWDYVPSIPSFGGQSPSASRQIELEGAVLTLSLEGWVRTDRKQSAEGSLVSFEQSNGGPEILDIQALRAYAETPVEIFSGGLQENIRAVCKDAAMAPLSERQLGPATALILRFSCETTARARTTGGLKPFEAGLYAIVPTAKAMVVIQRAWSGTSRPEDFPVLTLRPDWRAFLDGLSVCDPGQGQVCPSGAEVNARPAPAAPPARQTRTPQTG